MSDPDLMSTDKLPYRQSTIGIIVDPQNKFLLVQKQGYENQYWKFPGGGVEEGETDNQALKRELKEELGASSFKILAKSSCCKQYNWPKKVIKKKFEQTGQLFRGQIQTQFLVRFTGQKDKFKTNHEIIKLKWVSQDDLPDYLNFPQQWEDTKKALQEFEDLLND